MSTDTPVLDTIADITAASIGHSSGSPREFMLDRLAALIAVDAPPASYLANAPALEEAGLTADDIQRVMIAVAPVVGTPRVVPASGRCRRDGRPGRRLAFTPQSQADHPKSDPDLAERPEEILRAKFDR